MFGIPTWLLIFPVLGFLILVHELGHFLTAKRFGIKVTEFGFGFPPRIFGVRYGETVYSINWIPLGGFVRMVGEEDPTGTRKVEVARKLADEFVSRSNDEEYDDARVPIPSETSTTEPTEITGEEVTYAPDDVESTRDLAEQFVELVASGDFADVRRVTTAKTLTDNFVKIVEEADPDDFRRLAAARKLADQFISMAEQGELTDPGSFAAASVYKRAVVLLAGSFMNFVTPVVIFTILFLLPQDTLVGSVTINGVAPNSPAAEAGLRAGDTIISVNGHKVDNTVDLIQRILTKLGSEIELAVRRGAIVTGLGVSPEFSSIDIVLVTPRLVPPKLLVVDEVIDPDNEVSLADARRYNGELELGDTMTQGAVGVLIGTTNSRIVKRSHPIWDAVPMSVGRVRDTLLITKNSITSFAAGGPNPGFAGPVGIAQVTGEVARIGIAPVFELMALISISLGVVNILPIPALDGGRLVFVVLEWARRGKRISPQREGMVHLAGFVVLLGAIVAMSYLDIVRLIEGGSFIR